VLRGTVVLGPVVLGARGSGGPSCLGSGGGPSRLGGQSCSGLGWAVALERQSCSGGPSCSGQSCSGLGARVGRRALEWAPVVLGGGTVAFGWAAVLGLGWAIALGGLGWAVVLGQSCSGGPSCSGRHAWVGLGWAVAFITPPAVEVAWPAPL
jgi:hypothetical protein